jgi:alanyl-tRNA synthetase
MLSAEIRQSFLNFFERQGHRKLPSSSLIPHEDPSVLLTTAGMQQFKPIFMGQAQPPAPKATTVQKCFRTVDLDEVGDSSHLTFFEMLGNFSFGDYFKEGAIEFAWEYLTRELSLDAARLQPTAHPTDDDASALWKKVSGKDVIRLEDNFWGPAGASGPCGPDSEVHFDFGPEAGCRGPDCYPGHCDRYLEVWNLVFMQFDQLPDGSRQPLARTGVDTGMGLERLAVVVNGLQSVHDTDIFMALRDQFESRAGASGGRSGDGVAFSSRLLADHARGTAFLIADGVRPGNEGRGYVLRRMIRRATLHGERRLGIEGPLSGSVSRVVELMGDAYPELGQRRSAIETTLKSEEAAFRRTLDAGQSAFAEVASKSSGIIRGEDAFRLHDTYGFPIDLTVELAAEQGLSVDREGFNEQLAQQRLRSRRGAKRTAVQRTGLPATRFLGYDTLAAGGIVQRIFRGDADVEAAHEGDEVEVYLDRTPMYAEGGGQVGDIGIIEGPLGTVEVRDVQRQGDAHAHYGVVVSGELLVGEEVQVEVDHEARWATMRHHSATHLLHRALQTVLGDGATQAGSYVAPDTCTFDFNLDRAVSADEMDAVFRIVNRAVRDDLPKTTDVMALEDARRSGAMMLFGEKYGDVVRVVSFGQFSTELCGGTHVERTGQIGAVVPVTERSVGAGLRRLEFFAGERAESYQRDIQAAAEAAARVLRVGRAELADRVEALIEERKRLQKDIDDLRRRSVEGDGNVPGHGFADGIAYQIVGSDDADFIRSLADRLLEVETTAQAALVIGGSGDSGRVVVKTRRGANLNANDAFGRIRAAVGGKGGGNEVLAQGGGFSVTEFDRIVDALKTWIIEKGEAKDQG